MKQYFVTLAFLVLLYEMFILFQAFRLGKKVDSGEAVRNTFIRSSVLMLIMTVLLLIYQFLRVYVIKEVWIGWELIGLFVIVLFLASQVESFFAKRPLFYEKDDTMLILTSVRNDIDLTRVTGVNVANNRVEIELVGRPARSIHLADDKIRREIARRLRARVRENRQ